MDMATKIARRFHITKAQDKRLKAEAKRRGISAAQIVREALDAWQKRGSK